MTDEMLEEGAKIRAAAGPAGMPARRNGRWTSFAHECWFLWLLDHVRDLAALARQDGAPANAVQLAAEWAKIEEDGWDEPLTIREGAGWTSASLRHRNDWLLANGGPLLEAAIAARVRAGMAEIHTDQLARPGLLPNTDEVKS